MDEVSQNWQAILYKSHQMMEVFCIYRARDQVMYQLLSAIFIFQILIDLSRKWDMILFLFLVLNRETR